VANDSGNSLRPSKIALFAWLIAASIVAIAAMSPALLVLLDPARRGPLSNDSVDPVRFMIGFGIANIFLSAIAITIGLRLEPTVRMGVPVLRCLLGPPSETPCLSSSVLMRCVGLAVGLAAVVLTSALALRTHLPELPDNFVFPPVWQGILMMLGAAVREEILFRFGAMNLLAWLAMKILRQPQPTTSIVWTANIVVALAFAGLHLVPAAQLLDLNAVATAAAVALATLAGAFLGLVYWRHGLLMAILTHAIAGLVVYLGARALIAFAA
jgi:hypothetical protein